MDTVFADVPAIDDGSMAAQIFVGLESKVIDVHGMKTDKEFVATLQDEIRKRGAMDKLISDRAQSEISKKVKDILRYLFIGAWQSEPHHQHQNPGERKYQDLKRTANSVMDRTGAPAYTWLLALMYVAYVLNHVVCASIGNVCPLTPSRIYSSRLGFLAFWVPGKKRNPAGWSRSVVLSVNKSSSFLPEKVVTTSQCSLTPNKGVAISV